MWPGAMVLASPAEGRWPNSLTPRAERGFQVPRPLSEIGTKAAEGPSPNAPGRAPNQITRLSAGGDTVAWIVRTLAAPSVQVHQLSQPQELWS